jgi:hypothetical protein
MDEEHQRVTLYFRSRLDQAEGPGPQRTLLEALSSQTHDFSALDSPHVDRNQEWLRKSVLDLLLDCIGTLLEDRALSKAELAVIGDIKKHLAVREGDFLRYRPVEIAGLLASELEKILEDLTIDSKEDLYQVELQAVFDLSYDQYLSLARRAFEDAQEFLARQLRLAQETGDAAQLTSLQAKAKFLDPILQLALLQPRTIGALD